MEIISCKIDLYKNYFMIPQVKGEDLKAVWQVLLRLEKALVEKNPAELERILAADFIGAIPTGESFSKTAYINHHCTPGFGIVALSGQDMEASDIRMYNDTAVINRKVHSHFKLPTGLLLEYDVQRIEVFVKQNNKWLMVSGQGTKVLPPPGQN
jgi:hypothetical protein